jgi:TonB-dependent receptor
MFAPSRSRYIDIGGETIPSDSPDSISMFNHYDKFLFEHYEVNQEKTNDDKYALQIDAKKTFNWAWLPAQLDAQFGVRYTDKSKRRNGGTVRIQGPNGIGSDYVGKRTMADSLLSPVATLLPGGDYAVRNLVWQQVPNEYAHAEFRYPGFYVPSAKGQFYRVDEKIISGYAQVNVEFNLADVPVQANAGLRIIDTGILSFGYHQRQNSDGSTGYTTKAISQKGRYTKALPSINVVGRLTNKTLLRFAASQTFIRPALADIAYQRTASWGDFKFQDGNPDLKPTYAKQWELGLEYYFPEGGLLSVSYFAKDMTGVVREKMTGVAQGVTKYNDNGTVDGVYDYDIYQKVNAEGSSAKGWEFVAQLPLGRVWPSLSGFGVNANYTLLNQSLGERSALGIPVSPTGVADSVYNTTLYYENDSFNAQLSYRYKDEYVKSIGYQMHPNYIDSYGQYDFSVNYRLTDEISVSLKGINIRNEALTGFSIDRAFPSLYQLSGRRLSLAIRLEL